MVELPRVDIFCSFAPAYDSQNLLGIAKYCGQFGAWRIRVAHWPEGPAPGNSSDADGVLLINLRQDQVDHLSHLKCPIVGVNSGGQTFDVPCVTYDEPALGRAGAEHLLGQGLRRFAFAGSDTEFSRLREEGFNATVRAAGYQAPLSLRDPSGRRPDWEQLQDSSLLQQWLSQLPRPIGLMVLNDVIAVRVLWECRSMDLHVPGDVAVIGVDNVQWLCETAPTPLSSVDRNGEELGYQAARLLGRLMNGEQPERNVLMPPAGVVARRSTDLIDPNYPELMQAVHFIHDHACDPITLDDVLKAVPMSRSSLHRLFNDVYGRSPGDEIRGVRLKRAKKLLAETDLPIDDVARQCGFGWSSYLSRAFSQAFHITPARFRAQARGEQKKAQKRA